jgi:hypothetical protein
LPLSKFRRRKSEVGQYAVVEAPASARVEVQEVRRLGAQGGTSSSAAFNGAQRSTVCSRESELTALYPCVRRCGLDSQWCRAGGVGGQWPKAVRPSGTRGCGAWHRPTGPPASRTGNTGRRMDRWAWQSLGVRAQPNRGAATCNAGTSARSGAPGRHRQFSLALFRRVLLKFLKQRWSECSIAKF